MKNLQPILLEALSSVDTFSFNPLEEDPDLYVLLGSLGTVNLILESEIRLESLLGQYVPLAGEDLFDAELSPLRAWSSWVSYVENCVHSI